MFANFLKPKSKDVQPPEKQSSTPTIEPGAVFYLKKNGFYIKIVVETIIPTGNNSPDFAFKININDNKTDSKKYVLKKYPNNIVETFASKYDPANLSLHDSRIFKSDNEIMRDPNIKSKLIPYLNGFTISKERPTETYVKNIQTEIYKEPQEELEEPKGGKANTTRKFRVSKSSNIRRKNKLSKHRKLHRKKTKKLNRRI